MTPATPAGRAPAPAPASQVPASQVPASQVEAELAPYGPLPDGLGSRGLLSPDLPAVPPSFPAMIDALRLLQNRITGSAPGEELAAEVSRTLTDLAIRLGAHTVDEESQIAGRVDLPGRAQALVPVVHLDGQDDQHAVGRVTFGRLIWAVTGPCTAARSRWSSTRSWAGCQTPAAGRWDGPHICESITAISRPSSRSFR